MIEKNYLKTLLQKHGVKIGYICQILGIDRQKFTRWSEDSHPNNKVLRAAVKFSLRYLIETRDSEAERLLKIKEAEEAYRKTMERLGL